MARALRMLGARCYVTGIKPGIAQTLVHIGVDLRELHVHRTLRDALAEWIAEEQRARATGRQVRAARERTAG
jgi:rsbT co-antagonist protein RsbR